MRIVVFLCCLSLALAFAPKHDIKNLIVGGTEAPLNSRPYQAALFDDQFGGFYSQFCGGTLVHESWVVSAAHCIREPTVNVGLGFHDLRDSGQIIKGTWVNYPGYDKGTKDGDIALIKLDSPATLSDKVQPIAIASSGSDVAAGTQMLVSGWGTLSSGGISPYTLQQVVVSGVSRSDCDYVYRLMRDITDNMVCAAASGKDACQGDSGGPIVSHFDVNKHVPGVTLEGVVSWGYRCAEPSYPGVYTRVANVCSWMSAETGGAVSC